MVVAKVGNRAIKVEDFKYYLSQRPVSNRYQPTREDIQKRLEGLILEEVLYREALRLGLDKDPDVYGRIRQMLTQKLIDEQINQKEWKREVTQEELRAYYDQHLNEFNRPAQVRVADIFIAAPPDASKEERENLRQKAEKVLAEARVAKGQRMGFGSLVREYSDSPEHYRKGDTGFFDLEGQPVGIDKAVAEEAFRIEGVGNMAEHVIETPGGYHLIMLIGKRSAMERPLDSVQNELKQRMRHEAITKARQVYIDNLRDSTEIQIDENVISEMLAEMSKPKPNPKTLQAKIKTLEPQGSSERPPLLER